MSLQELVNNFGKEKNFSLEEQNEEKKLNEVLDSRFNLLSSYLFEKGIYTTGNLKKLSLDEYAMLKSDVSSLSGVGEERKKLFIDKLDEIINKRYFDNNVKIITRYGIIENSNDKPIEVNYIKNVDKEYMDIRRKNEYSESLNGISLKLEEAQQLMQILNQCFDNKSESQNNLLNIIFNKNKQGKITNQMIHASYEYGKKVINNELSMEEAVNYLNTEFSMNKSSAKMYIESLISMINGVVYTRKTSLYATEYFLNCIKRDFGHEAYNLAISSVRKHIEWNRRFNPNDLKSLENLILNLTSL